MSSVLPDGLTVSAATAAAVSLLVPASRRRALSRHSESVCGIGGMNKRKDQLLLERGCQVLGPGSGPSSPLHAGHERALSPEKSPSGLRSAPQPGVSSFRGERGGLPKKHLEQLETKTGFDSFPCGFPAV